MSTGSATTAPDYAALFKVARHACNLDQQAWATMLHVSVETVSLWERGLRVPSDSHLQLVREVLKGPVLRRRIYFAETAEHALIEAGLVEPLEAAVRQYQGLREFLRETGVLVSPEQRKTA